MISASRQERYPTSDAVRRGASNHDEGQKENRLSSRDGPSGPIMASHNFVNTKAASKYGRKEPAEACRDLKLPSLTDGDKMAQSNVQLRITVDQQKAELKTQELKIGAL